MRNCSLKSRNDVAVWKITCIRQITSQLSIFYNSAHNLTSSIGSKRALDHKRRGMRWHFKWMEFRFVWLLSLLGSFFLVIKHRSDNKTPIIYEARKLLIFASVWRKQKKHSGIHLGSDLTSRRKVNMQTNLYVWTFKIQEVLSSDKIRGQGGGVTEDMRRNKSSREGDEIL